MKITLISAILILFVFNTGAFSQTTVAKKTTATKPKTTTTKSDFRRLFTFRAGVTTLFDSNIEHDPIAKRAYGVIPSLGIGYQVDWKKNSFEFNYQIAQHVYNVDTKYKRTSHALDATYERKITDRFRSRTTADISIRGSSDEREINNQFAVIQRFELRANSKNRFYLIGAYKVKRYVADDADSNASNPYWGLKYRRYFGKKQLELGYRYEKNKAVSARNTYIQPRFEAEFKTPLFYRSNLDLSVSYKPRKYAGRFIEVNGVDVPRRDKRWKFEANWERPMTERFVLGAYYKFEKRNSNDIEKLFNAHQVGVSFSFNWTKGFDD